MSWRLHSSPSVVIAAERDGVLISQTGTVHPSDSSRLGRILPAVMLQLSDMEIGQQTSAGWLVPYSQFASLENTGIDAFESLCKWSPLTLELESTRWIGAQDFHYLYRFYKGRYPVSAERVGCFIRTAESVFRLDPEAFALLESIDAFNASGPEERSNKAILEFSKIKGLALSIGAKLDKYIAAENVLLPSRLGVDIVPEADGRISFVPKVEGVPHDGLVRAFFASDDIEAVYAVDDSNGGRIRVVFDETQQEVLRRIQRVRHLGGPDKAKVLRNPEAVFDGISAAVDFSFGPRVTGVGQFPFSVKPYTAAGTGIFQDLPAGSKRQREFGLECKYGDGTTERVRFDSKHALLDFRNRVAEAQARGEDSIEFDGRNIAVSSELQTSLDELVNLASKERKERSDEKRAGQYVLIYTNEGNLEYDESSKLAARTPRRQLPASLSATTKEHQQHGFQWLRTTYELGRSGCLLADDMGLGKTLQVLLFLASLIEGAEFLGKRHGGELPPWNPILIIAPVILVENGTWEEEIRVRFKGEGAIFDPVLVLTANSIKTFLNPEVHGRETAIGQPVLDLDKLRRFKVIITNYETVVNYQHSFAKVMWTAVVTDEAQEYKTPSTKVSHAMKALATNFRIACTGTPVETKLFDIWNLFDFLQPGPLLGSASEFKKAYEAENDRIQSLPKLKQRLRLGSPDAHLLRRNKEEVLDLPPKHEHYLESTLSVPQLNWHVDLLNRRLKDGPESHPFSILHNLMRVSQHHALVPRFEPVSPEDAIRTCPKLQSVIQCLKDIRRKAEKVLIFTRSLDMQQLLALTLEHEFGFPIHIINGATNKNTQRVGNSRRMIVERFRKSDGFNILILSPDVAGIGLTIVEANHVIHYGRWWNPAKESQATDRVYRIGQSKDVHVYYPIARHPQGLFQTFDEKLDDLLRRRKQLASDFLTPMPPEDELQKELLQSLGVGYGDPPHEQVITCEDLSKLTWDRFESLVGLIEMRYGRQIWLSPKSGDGGVDVVARLGSEIRLIQCKHTQWTSTIDVEIVSELVDASDAFRESLQLTGFTFRPVLITNCNITRAVKSFCRDHDVEIVTGESFGSYLASFRCSRAEIESVENERYPSLGRLRSDLTAALSSRFQAGAGAN